MQDLANRGMGKVPAGFAADQERKAYQDQAAQQGNLYAGTRDQQRADAETNYWNATNMLNANATNTANLSLQANQAAASNYANLYGTASQQVQSGWGSVLGAAAGGIGAAGGAYAGAKCWIAEALWGKFAEETALVRAWLNEVFAHSGIVGGMTMWIYGKLGRTVARAVRENSWVRFAFLPLFEKALEKANEWVAENPVNTIYAQFIYGGE